MAVAANELLSRAVEKVVPLPLAEEKMKAGKKLRLYFGIDPTGSKLHIGHSVPLRKLRAFQDAGHEVIFLIGSFTAMIGDPSGRDLLREPLTREKVEQNFHTYKRQASKILDFDKLKVVYNHEWLSKLTFDEIAKVASNFTVQQMLARDMFQRRIKESSPIGSHEFLYPLMQAYDSLMLDVDCEIGGNDQLFNMLCGRTLQQVNGKRDKFVLTTKLINGTDGRKMSKTYENCVYLEDEPNDMYGKVMSIRDDLIPVYMECCTSIPMAEVKETASAMKSGVNPKSFKARLAREIVTLYYGAVAALNAEQEFTRVFKDKKLPEKIPEVSVGKGAQLIDVLVSSKLVASKSEARRLIEQDGVKMNNAVVQSIEDKISEGVLQVGKRKFVKIRFSS